MSSEYATSAEGWGQFNAGVHEFQQFEGKANPPPILKVKCINTKKNPVFEITRISPEGKSACLSLDRKTFQLSTKAVPDPTGAPSQVGEIINGHGIMGVIRLGDDKPPGSSSSASETRVAEAYLVMITKAIPVAVLHSRTVYGVTGATLIPVSTPFTSTDWSRSVQARSLIRNIQKYIETAGFYFSESTLELPNSTKQSFAGDASPAFSLYCHSQGSISSSAGKKAAQTPVQNIHGWGAVNMDFMWNAHMVQDFKVANCMGWVTPVIQGCVVGGILPGYGAKLHTSLVSRRSRHRAGSRTTDRGINSNGQTANFVETEVIIQRPEKQEFCSYVVVRGSAPLFWDDRGGVLVGTKPTPLNKPKSPEAQDALSKHFSALTNLYNSFCVLSLLDPRNDECLLKETMEKAIQIQTEQQPGASNRPSEYVHMDSNAIKFKRYSEFVSAVEGSLLGRSRALGCFHFKAGTVKQKQHGVIRVNCLDCVNRTNLSQSAICQFVVPVLFEALGLASVNVAEAELKPEGNERVFESKLRECWVLNGDNISRQYCGTRGASALYSNDTKGKGVSDMIGEAKKHMTRLYVNKRDDGGRSIAQEMFLGSQFGLSWECDMRKRLLMHQWNQFVQYDMLRVLVCTWNCNGQIIGEKEDISSWIKPQLADKVSPKIVVIGLQEFVPLNAANIIKGSSEDKVSGFKKMFKRESQKNAPDENVDDERLLRTTAQVEKVLGKDYSPIDKKQLVGLFLIVFVHKSIAKSIKEPEISYCSVGEFGLANKGGVGFRCRIQETTMCFLVSHLAAHMQHNAKRNEHFHSISNELAFNAKPSFWNCPVDGKTFALGHDATIWFGDLNYRIETSGAFDNKKVRELCDSKDIERLRKSDQLINSRMKGESFAGFREGTLNFIPTFKYDLNTTRFDTSEKQRAPAWCDRVLFKGLIEPAPKGQQGYPNTPLYNRVELLTSDHRPVHAAFDIGIARIIQSKLSIEQQNINRYISSQLKDGKDSLQSAAMSQSVINLMDDMDLSAKPAPPLPQRPPPSVMHSLMDDELQADNFLPAKSNASSTRGNGPPSKPLPRSGGAPPSKPLPSAGGLVRVKAFSDDPVAVTSPEKASMDSTDVLNDWLDGLGGQNGSSGNGIESATVGSSNVQSERPVAGVFDLSDLDPMFAGSKASERQDTLRSVDSAAADTSASFTAAEDGDDWNVEWTTHTDSGAGSSNNPPAANLWGSTLSGSTSLKQESDGFGSAGDGWDTHTPAGQVSGDDWGAPAPVSTGDVPGTNANASVANSKQSAALSSADIMDLLG